MHPYSYPTTIFKWEIVSIFYPIEPSGKRVGHLHSEAVIRVK